MTTSHRFLIADVFTDRPFGGNQLAVLPEAGGLSDERMQQVAREFNFSETVFVLPPAEPEFACSLRIFTPQSEIPFAGHPTVGTAIALATIGEIPLDGDETHVLLGEPIGPVQVCIRCEGGRPNFAKLTAARPAEVGPELPSRGELASILRLESADIVRGDFGPEAVSSGVPFTFVGVESSDAIRRASINRTLWQRLLRESWAPNVFVFTLSPDVPGVEIHARMFSPALGIAEDPATGAAAVALADYLARRDARKDGLLQWRIAQGIEMGRPSLIEIEAEKVKDRVAAVRVGGRAVVIADGRIELPDHE